MGDSTAMSGFSTPQIEQAAISVLMQWPEPSFALVEAHAISTEHFQTPANRILFDALQAYWRKGKPVELIPLTHELRELGVLQAIGGEWYVTTTWTSTSHSPAVLGYYLGILEEAHAKLLLSITCSQANREAAVSGTEGEPLVIDTIETLAKIPLPSRHRNHGRTIAQAADEKFDRMVNGETDADLVSTGLTDLDYYSPLRAGDMPLIAGPRKAGKSILSLNVALNIARRQIPVLYFSLEDREPKLMDRIMAIVSRRSMNYRGINPAEKENLLQARDTIKVLPFDIRDDVFELHRIVAITRELKARKNIGLVVVDYGQLVAVPERKDVNREQNVAEVSRTLRRLAMEIATPLILLSQLNDAGLTRESRALEQDATAMWKIDLVEAERANKHDPVSYETNLRAITIPWQRNGESGVGFKITFIGEQARVENYAAN